MKWLHIFIVLVSILFLLFFIEMARRAKRYLTQRRRKRNATRRRASRQGFQSGGGPSIQDVAFIFYSTPNYKKLTDRFLENLASIGVKPEQMFHKLDIPPPSVSTDKTGFRTSVWYYAIISKIRNLVDMLKSDKLKSYKYIISTDCDIMYYNKNMNQWSNLLAWIDASPKDIFFMKEGATDINGGFYIIKNNERLVAVISFFEEVLKTLDSTPHESMPFADQTIINNLKHTLNYETIPDEYFILGPAAPNKEKALFHHATCAGDVDEKLAQIDSIKASLYS